MYQKDASYMSLNNYYPTSENWVSGSYYGWDFFIALLLCFVLIGFVVFIYMIIVKPSGELIVRYELSE